MEWWILFCHNHIRYIIYHEPYYMDLIIFCIMISNMPETDPIEHVRWRICISTLGKSFSDIAIDWNFLQRTMNRNQLTAAIIGVSFKSLVELFIKQSLADRRVRTLTFYDMCPVITVCYLSCSIRTQLFSNSSRRIKSNFQ